MTPTDSGGVCPECGAVWRDGQTCADHFHQMLAWEFVEPAAGVVHHLTVLGYHLQHPSLVSAEGLAVMQALLIRFLETDISPQEMRQALKTEVDSGRRNWTFRGAPALYDPPIEWTQHIQDATRTGLEDYAEHVREWAASIYKTLKERST